MERGWFNHRKLGGEEEIVELPFSAVDPYDGERVSQNWNKLQGEIGLGGTESTPTATSGITAM